MHPGSGFGNDGGPSGGVDAEAPVVQHGGSEWTRVRTPLRHLVEHEVGSIGEAGRGHAEQGTPQARGTSAGLRSGDAPESGTQTVRPFPLAKAPGIRTLPSVWRKPWGIRRPGHETHASLQRTPARARRPIRHPRRLGPFPPRPGGVLSSTCAIARADRPYSILRIFPRKF